MAWAASTRPLSTSRRADSTRRAMKGMAAMLSGTMAAGVPMEVPTMSRVNGMMATSKMMKGVERMALTTSATARFRLTIGSTPLRSVRCSKMPSGRPMAVPMAPDMATMIRVSPSDVTNRSMSADDMIELLYGNASCGHERHGFGNLCAIALRLYDQ